MVPNSSNGSDLGRYLAMGQVGMEMAAPIGIGAAVDYWLGWRPWGVVVGACLGLIFGLVLLVRMSRREDPALRGRDHKEGP
jgi:F0F1-type ATP synthase assembly protein I